MRRPVQRRSASVTLKFAGVALACALSAPNIQANALAALSARSHLDEGERILVPFRVHGSSSRTVLIRAVGKTLEDFGVSDAMADPQLRLLDATGFELEANDNWGSPAANRSILRSMAMDVGAFSLSTTSPDAALGLLLAPGGYVAEITGKQAGVVLVELYDVDSSRAGSSVRHVGILAETGSGAQTLIAGLVVGGPGERQLGFRAVGPSLTLARPLADPVLSIFEGATLRSSNDDWNAETDGSWFAQVGASPLTANSGDAAANLEFGPGALTLHVTSNGASSGQVLLEAYELLTGDAPQDLLLLPPRDSVAWVGEPLALEVVALGPGPYTYQWSKDNADLAGATAPVLTVPSAQRLDAGAYAVTVTSVEGAVRSAPATVQVVAPPAIEAAPQSQSAHEGERVELVVEATSHPEDGALRYQWTKDGKDLPKATSATLVLSSVLASDAGEYRVIVSNDVGSVTSDAAEVRLVPQLAVGAAEIVGLDIKHPNGNIYHQILLTGDAATVSAEPGKVTRVSFLDLNDDIVQVEFSGAGTLTLQLDAASGPVAPTKYVQPGVTYMKGHPYLVIAGADESTNVSAFSVGRVTAVNQSLFKDDETYDGVADVGYIMIESSNGGFGGIWAGNMRLSATNGVVGILAPGVTFSGPVRLGDLRGEGGAVAMLMFGAAAEVAVAGGNLHQPNGGIISVQGTNRIVLGAGQTSQGVALPAQVNQGKFDRTDLEIIDANTAAP